MPAPAVRGGACAPAVAGTGRAGVATRQGAAMTSAATITLVVARTAAAPRRPCGRSLPRRRRDPARSEPTGAVAVADAGWTAVLAGAPVRGDARRGLRRGALWVI